VNNNDDRPVTKHDLELMGIDPDDHDQLRAFRKDLEWARSNRVRCATLTGKIITYVALVVAGGTVALFWDGLKAKVGG
jgi:hypothetical protein